jgi:hypothetical protein
MTPNRQFVLAVVAAAFAAFPSVALAQSSTPPIRWVGGSGQLADFDFAGRGGAHGDAQTSAFTRQTNELHQRFPTIPAQPYAGHTIRFSVFLRTAELSGGGGNLWARADATSQQNVAFGTTQQTPVRGTTDWTQVSLSLSIPQNAATLYIGVLSHGTGSLWIDDARLEADGGVPTMDFGFELSGRRHNRARHRRGSRTPRDPPRGLANLTAFTSARLRALLSSSAGPWRQLGRIRGARHSRRLKRADARHFASALRTVFAPIATSVCIRAHRRTGEDDIETRQTRRTSCSGDRRGGLPTGGARRELARRTSITVKASSFRSARSDGDPRCAERWPVRRSSRNTCSDPSRPLVVALDGGVRSAFRSL